MPIAEEARAAEKVSRSSWIVTSKTGKPG